MVEMVVLWVAETANQGAEIQTDTVFLSWTRRRRKEFEEICLPVSWWWGVRINSLHCQTRCEYRPWPVLTSEDVDPACTVTIQGTQKGRTTGPLVNRSNKVHRSINIQHTVEDVQLQSDDVGTRNERCFSDGMQTIDSVIYLYPLWVAASHYTVDQFSTSAWEKTTAELQKPRSNAKVESYFGEMKQFVLQEMHQRLCDKYWRI